MINLCLFVSFCCCFLSVQLQFLRFSFLFQITIAEPEAVKHHWCSSQIVWGELNIYILFQLLKTDFFFVLFIYSIDWFFLSIAWYINWLTYWTLLYTYVEIFLWLLMKKKTTSFYFFIYLLTNWLGITWTV